VILFGFVAERCVGLHSSYVGLPDEFGVGRKYAGFVKNGFDRSHRASPYIGFLNALGPGRLYHPAPFRRLSFVEDRHRNAGGDGGIACAVFSGPRFAGNPLRQPQLSISLIIKIC
jgi:hypothetical protein